MHDATPRIARLVLGMLQTNCYLVGCPETHSGMVIDPADSPDQILATANQMQVKIEQILLTHAHMDHIAALPALRQETNALVLAHPAEAEMLARYLSMFGLNSSQFPPILPDVQLVGGEEIEIGNVKTKVIHTPGHSAGGLSLSVAGALFTGDTLFAGGIGRVDLPGGSSEKLLESIRHLLEFPDGTAVYPGHGAESTILREKTDNPYL